METSFNAFGSFADIRPLSERLLKPPPQLICLALRKLPEVLFKLTLHFVPGAFDLKLVHRSSDILEVAIVRSSLFLDRDVDPFIRGLILNQVSRPMNRRFQRFLFLIQCVGEVISLRRRLNFQDSR